MPDIDTSFWAKRDIKCTSKLVPSSDVHNYCDSSDIFLTIQNHESRSKDLFDDLMKSQKKIFNRIILISPSNKDEHDSTEESIITKIKASSDEYMISEILSCINNEKKRQGKPIKLCIDISSLNSYVISRILMGCFDELLVSKYTLFYSLGENYNKDEINSELLDISKLEDISSSKPEDFTVYFASPGYHLGWCMECINTADPDSVAVFETVPGYTEESNENIINDIAWLKRIYPNHEVQTTNKGDLCNALDIIEETLEKHNKSNIRCLLFGPKSHVVAFTILYLLNQKITLTYGFPEEPSNLDITSTGEVNVYEILDLKLAGYLFGN